MTTTVGLKWNTYTPQVEGQVTRDLLALQSSFGDFLVVTENSDADAVINALGLEHGIGAELATLWILYKTEAIGPESPNPEVQTIERDLYAPTTRPNLDTDQKHGYYLKPQGRVGSPRISQNPMPTHHGPTDPMVILLWG
jgi:hypothetical protein